MYKNQKNKYPNSDIENDNSNTNKNNTSPNNSDNILVNSNIYKYVYPEYIKKVLSTYTPNKPFNNPKPSSN